MLQLNNISIFYFCIGLTCYSCQYPASPDCIENPGKYTTVECGKTDEGDDKDYCYTTRLEDTDEETGDPSKLLIFFGGLGLHLH